MQLHLRPALSYKCNSSKSGLATEETDTDLPLLVKIGLKNGGK